MATTIVDVARVAGVGKATVVRALRGTGYVSPATRDKVRKAAAELGYQPNHIARSLVLGKSELVGMVAGPFLLSAFYPYIKPIEHGIRQAGYSMLFYISTGDDPEAERPCFQELIMKRVAGVIVAPSSLDAAPEPFQEVLSAGIKMVIVDRMVKGVATPQVIVDQYRSGRLAAEHLLSLGHRRIAYLGMPETSYVGCRRAQGIRDAIEAAGVSRQECIFTEVGSTEEDGSNAAARLLKLKKRPTAIIARHDHVAVGVMQTLLAAGLSIPGDVSLVSHGDNAYPCHALRVPLTTVHVPTDRLASVAAKKLLEALSGNEVCPDVTVLDVNLVVRESTGPCG